MVAQQLERQAADQIFAALADATRRDIVRRVLRDEASVSTLARHYDMSFAAVQKHIAVLERAHVVTKRRVGREQLVSGDVATIRAAARLLGKYEEIWRGSTQTCQARLGAAARSATIVMVRVAVSGVVLITVMVLLLLVVG
jgi:DNA-binding transcriptional ArsR family regulator